MKGSDGVHKLRIIVVGFGPELENLFLHKLEAHTGVKKLIRLSNPQAMPWHQRWRMPWHMTWRQVDGVLLRTDRGRMKGECRLLLDRFPQLSVVCLTDRDKTLMDCDMTPHPMPNEGVGVNHLVRVFQRRTHGTAA